MSRTLVEEFDRRFAALHTGRCDLVTSAVEARLYAVFQKEKVLKPKSAATLLVRSAALVEQMINGITVRLWDDPFEWTLPERLPTAAHLIAYFDDVETARVRGFEFLTDDGDLDKSIPAPIDFQLLGHLLNNTLFRSEQYLSDAKTYLSRSEF